MNAAIAFLLGLIVGYAVGFNLCSWIHRRRP
jgi:hypothetical protein